MNEELFRFVSVRDAQRTGRPKVMRVNTWAPGAESAFVQALQAASPDRATVVAEAENFRDYPQYVGSVGATPPVIRDLDLEMLAGADAPDLIRVAEDALRRTTGAAADVGLKELIDADEVKADRVICWDSYLAAVFSATAIELERGWLDRVVKLWALLSVLVDRRDMTSVAVEDMVLSAAVILPDRIEIDAGLVPEEPPRHDPDSGDREVRGSEPSDRRRRLRAARAARRREAAADGDADAMDAADGDATATSATLHRYQRLRAASAAVRAAVIAVVPTIVFDAATPDLSNLTSRVLEGTLDPAVKETLVDEDIPLTTPPLVELPDVVAGRANAALVDHFDADAATPPAARRMAVVAEVWRRRGVERVDATIGDIDAGKKKLGIGRLLKAPTIGDLKVVRQVLAGYELGEFAHVENLLAKEEFGREHEVIDMAETELLEVDVTEETHLHDLQTTTRSELAREASTVLATTEAFNVGGTITASYGPYVTATVTGGIASSTSRTESTSNSQRFSRDVTERATDNLMIRSESYRRTLTRRTVTEKSTHALKGPDKGNATAVYRWVNKRYCAQVFNYGRRVLLEIGVPDPAVQYRWAAALGGDLDVDVDPPPSLTAPLGGELSPSAIDETNWQALSARFRVEDFPPPPQDLITTPGAYSIEPPAAPSTSGTAAQAVAAYKVSKELKITGGYQPLCFVAGVLVDGMRLRNTQLTAAEQAIVRAQLQAAFQSVLPDTSIRGVPLADALAASDVWLTWDPNTPLPLITPGNLWILSNITLSVLMVHPGQDRTVVSSLRNFLAAATGLGAVTLLVGTTSVAVNGGAVRTGGVVTAPQVIAGTEDTILPVGYSTQAGLAGVAITLEVLSVASAALRARWQLEAYNAILTAHASWEGDFRAAVAQAEIQAGVAIEGRNPQENAGIIAAELKRAVIGMLGGVTMDELVAVQPGDARDGPATGRPTPPEVNLETAAVAARTVQFYEQAFEWQNMSHMLYPYFWTGRSDWPEALQRQDADPSFRDFLRAGAARIVLPVRRGWEQMVGSRLSLHLPAWPNEPKTSTAPFLNDDPFLEITEEIREAQDQLRGGVPSGDPWPIILPTTLVAFDGTPMPSYPTACDPPGAPGPVDNDT
jgi:hypothetical protein